MSAWWHQLLTDAYVPPRAWRAAIRRKRLEKTLATVADANVPILVKNDWGSLACARPLSLCRRPSCHSSRRMLINCTHNLPIAWYVPLQLENDPWKILALRSASQTLFDRLDSYYDMDADDNSELDDSSSSASSDNDSLDDSDLFSSDARKRSEAHKNRKDVAKKTKKEQLILASRAMKTASKMLKKLRDGESANHESPNRSNRDGLAPTDFKVPHPSTFSVSSTEHPGLASPTLAIRQGLSQWCKMSLHLPSNFVALRDAV